MSYVAVMLLLYPFWPFWQVFLLCRLLWTSVTKIGDLCQGYQPSLLHCRHKELHEQNFENRQTSTS